MTKERELEFVSLFIKKHKRQRISGLIISDKRDKAIGEFNDPKIFDHRFILEFQGNRRSVDNLLKQYKKHGMSNHVYVISGNTDWDKREFKLYHILNDCLMSPYDTIGYCWKSHTAFYEWHESGTSFLLLRSENA